MILPEIMRFISGFPVSAFSGTSFAGITVGWPQIFRKLISQSFALGLPKGSREEIIIKAISPTDGAVRLFFRKSVSPNVM